MWRLVAAINRWCAGGLAEAAVVCALLCWLDLRRLLRGRRDPGR